jgi:hypothetical protein
MASVERINMVMILKDLLVRKKKNVTMRHNDQMRTIEGRNVSLTECRRDLQEQSEDGGRVH